MSTKIDQDKLLDEALMESFPGSDAPTYPTSHAGEPGFERHDDCTDQGNKGGPPMATAETQKKDGNENESSNQSMAAGSPRVVGSPITNEAYNVVSAIKEKLEGLDAYRKYAKDGDEQLWQQLTQSETQSLESLVSRLEQMVKDGKLRIQKAGSGSS